ncbi:MAG TPA: heat-inducible transcription repressor HrcA [Dehalococcoidia bacterium]|nr:heat-inducible transcription repressor HrcA [Dehalococcoidia bacterium]
MLSPRTETILKSIVEQYIARPMPVPSQGILADSNLRISPATIRHEMARLENEGYVTRPHTSAGAVPSDKGYRYYVESLFDLGLPLVEQRLITHLFHQVESELDEWLRLAAAIIAQMTQNMAVVSRPKLVGCRLKHLEVVALQDSLALLVLVLHGARVKQQLINFEQAIKQSDLSALSVKLNNVYHDLSLSRIKARATDLTPTEQQVTNCIIKMMQAEDEAQYSQPYLDGLHYITDQPEFANAPRLHELMQMVEQGNLLKVIIPPKLNTREVMVVIGQENEAEAIQNCSVVITLYGLHAEAVGTIGVIGPTRMPYARTIPTVNYLSTVLSQLVAELYGKQRKGTDTNDRARQRR